MEAISLLLEDIIYFCKTKNSLKKHRKYMNDRHAFCFSYAYLVLFIFLGFISFCLKYFNSSTEDSLEFVSVNFSQIHQFYNIITAT